MTEEEIQEFLEEALLNEGWGVRNLHQLQRREERGADLQAEKGKATRLVAVKVRPVKSDIGQLRLLASRRAEGELWYVFAREPTEDFHRAMGKAREDVTFLGPRDAHPFLVECETTSYLLRLFEQHPLVEALSRILGSVWQCRTVAWQPGAWSSAEWNSLWRLKDSALKVRAPLCVLEKRWDTILMERSEDKTASNLLLLDTLWEELESILDWTGSGPVTGFRGVAETRPRLLSCFWSIVSQRTYWDDFILATEKLGSTEEFHKWARSFWIVPNRGSRSRRAALARRRMAGFDSCLQGLVHNLATVATDIDRGVDWLFEDVSGLFPRT